MKTSELISIVVMIYSFVRQTDFLLSSDEDDLNHFRLGSVFCKICYEMKSGEEVQKSIVTNGVPIDMTCIIHQHDM